MDKGYLDASGRIVKLPYRVSEKMVKEGNCGWKESRAKEKNSYNLTLLRLRRDGRTG